MRKTSATVRRRPVHWWALLAVVLPLVLLLACGEAETPEPELPTAPVAAGLVAGPETTPAAAAQGGTPQPDAAAEEPEAAPTGPLGGEIITRTPEPTATPGLLAEGAARVADQVGLTEATFLGLSTDDWIVLGFALLLIVVGYLAGTWLIRRFLPRAVKRTDSKIDDRLLEVAGADLRWLVVVVVFHLVTVRLTFLSVELKTLLADLYFVMALVLITRIVWHLVSLGDEAAHQSAAEEGREDQLAPVITLAVRGTRVLVAVLAVAVLLAHFGISATAIAAVLGLGGLAISLAARDTIEDAISGFLILVDQPFRIGDRIEIQEIGTWGDVAEIGLRTTKIRTRNNREVIIPNSIVANGAVVNYTFPDPTYRSQIDLGIGYGTDIKTVRRLIMDTVRQVEGVMPDKPVDVLYSEMGDSSMIFRVRWWIASYADRRRIKDRVFTILQETLDAAGVSMPFPTSALSLEPTSRLNLQLEQDTVDRLTQALRDGNGSSLAS